MTDRPPDPDSLSYAQYWEPVLAGPAQRLLARISAPPTDYLDIGAGTGSLTLAAARRWSQARIVGLDASAGMLSVARDRVATEHSGDDPRRFDWIAADAAQMPLGGASFDLVTSSFMLQLVDDRPAVLREVRRVLRPGGCLGLVTWIAEELRLDADDVFSEVVEQLGMAEPSVGFRPSRSTDYQHIDEARDELLAGGFSEIDAGADELRYSWTRAQYLDFKEHYDDQDLFESLVEADRVRLRAAVTARWSELPDAAFSIKGPLVWALARRPAEDD
jgi:ubiquinone/menaquinone biosynthesis C-methylase UbiE